MLNYKAMSTSRRKRQFGRFMGEWVLVFGLLLFVIWLVTQEANAPQLILLLLLYIITINFSLPPAFGGIGLTPVVAVSSLLVVGLETAVYLAAISFLVAELARPLWNPMWDYVNLKQPNWRERLGVIAVHLLALSAAGFLYRQFGGSDPLLNNNLNNPIPFAALAVGYSAIHFVLEGALWLSLKRPLRQFLSDNAPGILTTTLLAQPFAIFGGITFVSNGMPIFVIFSLGIMVFSLVTWLSWQRRYVAQQQLSQFSLLNQISLSLRETLDLPTVLARTQQQVTTLVSADEFAIALCDEDGEWQRPFHEQTSPAAPNDLVQWVAANRRPLDLHSRNLHYATQHNLALPTPKPAAWLGVPLTNGEQFLGVMALTRAQGGQPFSRWNQELLLAIAGQVSAAIQNARLYSATLRLYNLTDEALARRLEQLQALLNAVQEGVLMLDINGRIVLVNPMAAALLQNSAEALHQQPLAAATAVSRLGYTLAEWEERQLRLQAAAAPPGQTAVFAITLETATGSARRIIERSEATVRAKAGQVMGWLLVLRDVTEEQELAEQRTDLTRMIVHDLRNPITTLVSTIRAIEHEAAGGNGIQELINDAQQGCVDMLDMVDSLMDINRM
ncbi:MAG: GAF domain-containing protein, partial [Anaerolineales bacterium]|nr:GAF domain-containing protein [Anaerolineales bacterium]